MVQYAPATPKLVCLEEAELHCLQRSSALLAPFYGHASLRCVSFPQKTGIVSSSRQDGVATAETPLKELSFLPFSPPPALTTLPGLENEKAGK